MHSFTATPTISAGTAASAGVATSFAQPYSMLSAAGSQSAGGHSAAASAATTQSVQFCPVSNDSNNNNNRPVSRDQKGR